ncbi:MAG: hypothetical protein KKD73_05880 [Proteobacteria bacterium]|nr:hypothetical protein [Pseudomonadota bacterium]MBU1639874.1 hypothetical protein [Pseudomonadota bacterium]
MEIQPDLSICLLPVEGGADLAVCLEALFACADPLSLEIFVPLGTACGEFQDSAHLHFVDWPLSPDSSFVKAVWQLSRGRYFALWHGGVVASSPATLATLVEFLDTHPDVAAVGPRFFNGEGDILATAFARRTALPLADPVMPGWDGLGSMEVDWLSGAALVVNSLALADITLPTSSLGGIWERTFCQRLQSQGWHIFFVDLARVVAPDRFCTPTTLWQRFKDDWRRMLAFMGST